MTALLSISLAAAGLVPVAAAGADPEPEILGDASGVSVWIPGAPRVRIRAVPPGDRPLSSPGEAPRTPIPGPRARLSWRAGDAGIDAVVQRAKGGVYLHAEASPGAAFRLEIEARGGRAGPAVGAGDGDLWIEAKLGESARPLPPAGLFRIRGEDGGILRMRCAAPAAGIALQGGREVPVSQLRLEPGKGGATLFLSREAEPALPFLLACRPRAERVSPWGAFEVEARLWDPAGGLEAELALEPEGGGARVSPGFRDGDRLLFRGCPMGARQFRWSVRARNAAGEVRTAPAEGAAAPAAERGFVRSDAGRLLFSDGSPFAPRGINLGWVEGDREGEGFERYLERMRRAGLDHARVWLCSWGIHLDGDRPGEFREGEARRLDAVLAAARARGITVTLVLENSRDFVRRQNGPFWEEQGGPCRTPADFFEKPEAWAIFEARLRYVLARWGADSEIAAFELWNEIDQAGAEPAAVTPWIERAAAAVKALDPAGRPVTVSVQGITGWERVLDVRPLDLLSLHDYIPAASRERLADLGRIPARDLARLLRDGAALADGRGKPVVLSEFGANGEPGAIPVLDRDPTGIHLRQGLWASALAGYAGPGWPWWWDSYVEKNDLWGRFRALSDFLRGEEWAFSDPGRRRLKEEDRPGAPLLVGVRSPDRALLWIRAAGADWFSQVVERKRPPPLGPQTIRLPGMTDGAYAVEWWDTDEGRLFKSERFRSGGGVVLLRPPADRPECAAKVRRESE